jgi:hypothetical protein
MTRRCHASCRDAVFLFTEEKQAEAWLAPRSIRNEKAQGNHPSQMLSSICHLCVASQEEKQLICCVGLQKEEIKKIDFVFSVALENLQSYQTFLKLECTLLCVCVWGDIRLLVCFARTSFVSRCNR